MGLPFIESHLDKLSSWNQGLMLKFLEKVTLIHRETFILFFPQVFYSKSLFQINSIKTVNKGNKYHSAQYKQGFNFDEVTKFMMSNLNTKIKENPLLKIFNSLVDSYRAKKQVYWFGEMQLNINNFNLSENAQNAFGKIFEPELLKYFNKCGEIFRNQQRWWRSGLLYTEQSNANIFVDQSKECDK